MTIKFSKGCEAAAVYHLTTGRFLGMVRRRQPQLFGNKGERDSGVPNTLPLGGNEFISFSREPSAPISLCEEIEARLCDYHGVSNGNLLLFQLVQQRFILDNNEEVVFLECYLWEKPKKLLDDAVKLLVFHGKAVRKDLLELLEKHTSQEPKIA